MIWLLIHGKVSRFAAPWRHRGFAFSPFLPLCPFSTMAESPWHRSETAPRPTWKVEDQGNMSPRQVTLVGCPSYGDCQVTAARHVSKSLGREASGAPFGHRPLPKAAAKVTLRVPKPIWLSWIKDQRPPHHSLLHAVQDFLAGSRGVCEHHSRPGTYIFCH